MKEELLLLVLSIGLLSLISVHAYKLTTKETKTKVVYKWYNYNF